MSRQEAIKRLKNAETCGDFLVVDGQRIRKEDRDKLLKQLEENKVYLEVPLELYLVSKFWRALKTESNLEVRQVTRTV